MLIKQKKPPTTAKHLARKVDVFLALNEYASIVITVNCSLNVGYHENITTKITVSCYEQTRNTLRQLLEWK